MTDNSDGSEARVDLDPSFTLVDGREAVLTRTLQRLRLHRYEWPLAVDQGPDYFGDTPTSTERSGILGRGNQYAQAQIVAELRKANIEAVNVTLTRNPDTRAWRIGVQTLDDFIETEITA